MKFVAFFLTTAFAARQSLILMDAGSTGTRVYVFNWNSINAVGTLKEVGRKRLHPGLNFILNFVFYILLFSTYIFSAIEAFE